jgi:hypothetical protein
MPLPFQSKETLPIIAQENLLKDIVDNTGQLLTEFAQSNQFLSGLETSFGNNYDTEETEALQKVFLVESF